MFFTNPELFGYMRMIIEVRLFHDNGFTDVGQYYNAPCAIKLPPSI
jgi:hypothetical protein